MCNYIEEKNLSEDSWSCLNCADLQRWEGFSSPTLKKKKKKKEKNTFLCV